MTRLICRLAVAASVLLAAVATAAGGTRPVDGEWRGPERMPTVPVVQSPSVHVDGFDWVDAGIGAAAAVGLGLLLAGTSAFVRRRHRLTAFR